MVLSFPSGRTAEEVVVDNAAGLAWIVNLGCIELHPHPVRSRDLDHPDELRVDFDPAPGVPWEHVRTVALEVKALLSDMGLHGWPKTSGSRGMHVNVRIQPKWTFAEVRRAAVALSRAVEHRRPDIASSKWWKEERHGVFLDCNQNAKDRTTCSAYSVRPLPDARVSTPLDWREVPDCDPADFTIFTVPMRFLTIGDPHADIDRHAGSLEKLMELAAKDEAEGLGDARLGRLTFAAQREAPRVAPSRARSAPKPRAKMPLITVANSPDRDAAFAGLERWKAKYPAAAHLAVDDVLVDAIAAALHLDPYSRQPAPRPGRRPAAPGKRRIPMTIPPASGANCAPAARFASIGNTGGFTGRFTSYILYRASHENGLRALRAFCRQWEIPNGCCDFP